MTTRSPLHSLALPITLFTALSLLSGCVRTVAGIVTAPVRVASKGVDVMTTSQSEADEKRGRNLRHAEERRGKLDRDYRRHNGECLNGNRDSCEKARLDYAEMQNLRY